MPNCHGCAQFFSILLMCLCINWKITLSMRLECCTTTICTSTTTIGSVTLVQSPPPKLTSKHAHLSSITWRTLQAGATSSYSFASLMLIARLNMMASQKTSATNPHLVGGSLGYYHLYILKNVLKDTLRDLSSRWMQGSMNIGFRGFSCVPLLCTK